MPPSAIPGFVKKKTASQRYKRSPRQLTRDITLAIELQNKDVLPHLCIQTEEGEDIEGNNLTPGLMEKLIEDGQNPMWYLRRTWLEETFGRREKGDALPTESEDKDKVLKVPSENDTAVGDGILIEMMKDSIEELKQDKKDLKGQLAIKDEQIKETTERWKESNVLTQNLHKRIDKMEQQMEQLLLASGESKSPRVEDAIVIAKEEGSSNEKAVQKRKTVTKHKSQTNERTTTKKQRGKKPITQKPKWYEMPTVRRLASRFRSR